MAGTLRGPQSIISVSFEIEPYDDYVQAEAGSQYGIYTLPYLNLPQSTMKEAIDTITAEVRQLPLDDRLLVVLGGEHSITPGVVAGLADRHKDMVLVQIDAHCDLRDTFDGTQQSHAAAMRRCLPYVQSLLEFGIRSIDVSEVDFIKEQGNIKVWTGEALYRDKSQLYLQTLQELVAGKNVYLTIDVDGLDSSVMPSTGTPYPGGIGWYECLDIIRTVAKHGNVVAFDCVEFAPPVNGGKGDAHTVALLVYKTMNAIMMSRGKIAPE
jgi:agmatinase